MKNHVAMFVLGVAMIIWGCGPVARQVAKGAIDAGLAGCIAENPDATEPELKEICKWADELAPLVKDLLSARQKGAAKHAAKMSAANPACASALDAGK
jgi:hypothetical protein